MKRVFKFILLFLMFLALAIAVLLGLYEAITLYVYTDSFKKKEVNDKRDRSVQMYISERCKGNGSVLGAACVPLLRPIVEDCYVYQEGLRNRFHEYYDKYEHDDGSRDKYLPYQNVNPSEFQVFNSFFTQRIYDYCMEYELKHVLERLKEETKARAIMLVTESSQEMADRLTHEINSLRDEISSGRFVGRINDEIDESAQEAVQKADFIQDQILKEDIPANWEKIKINNQKNK